MSNKEFMTAFDVVTEQLVKAIESGAETGKWVRPWVSEANQRFTDGYVYTGSNQFFLSLYRFISTQGGYAGNHPKLKEAYERLAGTHLTQYWGAFDQWKAQGATVKLGAKGFPLIRQVTAKRKNKKEDGTDDFFQYFTSYVVFNSTQVEGWEPPVNRVETDEQIRSRFRTMIARHNIKVTHGGDRAFYLPTEDSITLPPVESFPVEDDYWSTLGHEAIHWTGHESRLQRIDPDNHRGDTYAFEELVAELGSAVLATQYGIEVASDANILAYLGGWAKRIKEDKTAVRKAMSLAIKAAQYLEKGGE
jgi:antirestriction protein ArdC